MLALTRPRSRTAFRALSLLLAGLALAGCGINTIPTAAGAGQGLLERGA